MSERKLRKFSAEQLKLRMNRQVMGDMASLGALGSYGDGVARKMDSEPEREFVVVSCENERCGQYVNVKVFELPKLRVSTAKLV
jgi:hypothetical protein